MTIPATRVEEREDGAVLVVLSDNPYPRAERKEEGGDRKAEEHLGL